jgi:hypothetical protein
MSPLPMPPPSSRKQLLILKTAQQQVGDPHGRSPAIEELCPLGNENKHPLFQLDGPFRVAGIAKPSILGAP